MSSTPMGRSVVVVYGPDQFGRAALAHGAAQAELRSSRLVVVNATRGDAAVDPRFATDDDIEGVRASLETLGLDVVMVHEVVPDVADAVVQVAEREDASVIVVGVRHRSPVGKALLRSVAQRVILDAPCPVLAVKPESGVELV